MSDVKIEVDSAAVLAAFENLKTADIYNAIRDSALLVERDAKLNCPVDTGNLRASIQTEINETDTEYVAEVGTNVEYAAFVEFGTKNMEAKPYLVPALEANRDTIKESIMNALKEAN